MKIKLSDQQVQALVQIIETSRFTGKDAEFIVQLKRDVQTEIEPVEVIKDGGDGKGQKR